MTTIIRGVFVVNLLWSEYLCPPQINMLKPYPTEMMTLGSGAFGRCFDHESSLMNDVSVFIRVPPRP